MELPDQLVLNCLAFLEPFRVVRMAELRQLCAVLPILHVVEFSTILQTSDELDHSFSQWGAHIRVHIRELRVKAGGIPRSFLRYLSAQGLTAIELNMSSRCVARPRNSEEGLRALAKFVAQGDCLFRRIAAKGEVVTMNLLSFWGEEIVTLLQREGRNSKV